MDLKTHFSIPLHLPWGIFLFSLGLAVFISFGEYFVRNHLHFLLPSKNIDPAFLNRDIRIGNKILPFYATLLFLLHFIRIFDNSFWADEGFSIRLAQMSISEMIAKTSTDVHPPLFYLLAQLLYHIFGNHGFTYHLSALLPYGILLILSCTVIKKMVRRYPFRNLHHNDVRQPSRRYL